MLSSSRCSSATAIVHRVLAGLPDLAALVAGRVPSFEEKLRRNVAWHAQAEGFDVLRCLVAALKRAQRGPRLGERPPPAPDGDRVQDQVVPTGPPLAVPPFNFANVIGAPEFVPRFCQQKRPPSYMIDASGSFTLPLDLVAEVPGMRCTCGAWAFSSCSLDAGVHGDQGVRSVCDVRDEIEQ